jgi:hypothetical protein
MKAAEPFFSSPEAAWIKQLSECVCVFRLNTRPMFTLPLFVDHRWAAVEPSIAPYGTNASNYKPTMVKNCVIMGPGSIDQAHQADEWILVSELAKMKAILRQWWLSTPLGGF